MFLSGLFHLSIQIIILSLIYRFIPDFQLSSERRDLRLVRELL